MALKTIKLTLGERQMAVAVLSRVTKGDIGTGRIMRSIRNDLKLRDADRDVKEMLSQAELAAKTDPKTRIPDWDDLMDEPSEEFTIDEQALRSLQEWAQGIDLSKARGENGQMQDISVLPAMLVAFATLADSIADALATKE